MKARKLVCLGMSLVLSVVLLACGGGSKPAPTLQSISISPDPGTISIPIGATQNFTATGTYNDGSTKNITAQATWSASDPTVVQVVGGQAKGLKLGTSSISVAMGSVSSGPSNPVTVIAATIASVVVTPSPASLEIGSSLQFTATGKLTDGTTQDLTATATWASSNTSVATITNPGGLATAVGNGTSTISAQDPVSSVTGSTVLTVGSKNGKLVGNYTFNLQASTGFLGISPVTAGAFTADGAGNILNGALDRNTGPSGTVSSVSFSGTYNIGFDGRGTISFQSASGYSFSGNIVLVGSGLAYLSETDSNGPAFGQMVLNNSGSFNNASVSGPYVLEIAGTSGGVGAGLVGQLMADGNGNFSSGIADLNVGGTTVTQSILGTYTITDSAHGRGTASVTMNTLPSTVFNFVIYVGSGSLVMVSSDAISPVRALAVPQTAATYNNGSVSGNYVFTGASILDTFSGQFASDGFNAWTNGVLDLSSHSTGMQFAVPFTANYGVFDGARGRFQTAEALQGGAVDNLVFYLIDSGRAFFIDFNSAQGAQGEFRKSTGAPYTNSSLSGTYSFYLQGCPLSGIACSGQYTQTGVFTADGNGNITISFDTNNAGNKTTQTLVAGSYVVGDSGSNGGLITTAPGKIRFYFVDGTHLFLEDGDTIPTRRVIGEAVKQN
jgi:hypothetical protein